MNSPQRDTDDARGAQVYTETTNNDPAGTPGTDNVRVYDRPEKQGSGMMGTVLLIIALLVIAALVWNFMF